MALTRKFLTDLGIEKEQLQSILDEHGSTVELIKEKAKEDAAKATEKSAAVIADLQEKIDNAPKPDPDGKDWKADYEALKVKYDADLATEKTAHQQTKDTYTAEKVTAEKSALLENTLLEAGANAKYVKKIAGDFKLEEIEIADGKIKDFDKKLEAVKPAWSEMFGQVTKTGASVATPPQGSQTVYTMDDIKKMSQKEINENWDNIKTVIEKG